MTMRSSLALQKLAYAVYLNTERDADVQRREGGRAALDAWRGAGNAGERAAAARSILLAARRYGLRPAARRRSRSFVWRAL